MEKFERKETTTTSDVEFLRERINALCRLVVELGQEQAALVERLRNLSPNDPLIIQYDQYQAAISPEDISLN